MTFQFLNHSLPELSEYDQKYVTLNQVMYDMLKGEILLYDNNANSIFVTFTIQQE